MVVVVGVVWRSAVECSVRLCSVLVVDAVVVVVVVVVVKCSEV